MRSLKSSVYRRIYKLEALFFQFIGAYVAAFQDFFTPVTHHETQI